MCLISEANCTGYRLSLRTHACVGAHSNTYTLNSWPYLRHLWARQRTGGGDDEKTPIREAPCGHFLFQWDLGKLQTCTVGPPRRRGARIRGPAKDGCCVLGGQGQYG